MLTKFEVSNFKGFNENLVFDLLNIKNYEFNKECVQDGVVKKALLYGQNGVGKSNLGLAIFDLVIHLTDKEAGNRRYIHYLNALNESSLAEFSYEFKFSEHTVNYSYGKKGHDALVYEIIEINGVEYASIDRRNSSIAIIKGVGAETLNKDLGDSQISLATYIKKNSVLSKDNVSNHCFLQFMRFVNGMLFFRSLQSNSYIGFEQGVSEIASDIIKRGNLKDFESFLNDAGVECTLNEINDGNKSKLVFYFDGKQLDFFEIASTGTCSLTLFYGWYQRLKEDSNATFVFIDEFDAFYHHKLSSMIVERLKEIRAQVVITTHNTSIMTNDLLRPDCYFVMNKNEIKPLANCTLKELREAHNLEKMYKAGAFSG